MIGTVIQNQFLEVRDYPLAASLSFVLMTVITLRRPGLRPRARHRGPRLMRRLVRWLMDGYAIWCSATCSCRSS
jgi:hypothetical protein